MLSRPLKHPIGCGCHECNPFCDMGACIHERRNTMRTFAPIPLVVDFTDVTFYGQCDQCGNGCTDEEKAATPSLYQVELAGQMADSYSEDGFICRRCYEASKERTFSIQSNNGEDWLATDFLVLGDVMEEIAGYLDSPEEYTRYAPFKIVACDLDGNERETIATIHMPEEY